MPLCTLLLINLIFIVLNQQEKQQDQLDEIKIPHYLLLLLLLLLTSFFFFFFFFVVVLFLVQQCLLSSSPSPLILFLSLFFRFLRHHLLQAGLPSSLTRSYIQGSRHTSSHLPAVSHVPLLLFLDVQYLGVRVPCALYVSASVSCPCTLSSSSASHCKSLPFPFLSFPVTNNSCGFPWRFGVWLQDVVMVCVCLW